MPTPRSALTAKQLAQVMLATLAVAGCPVAVVWWLRSAAIISSPLVGVILGIALSLGASWIGRLLWERRPRSEDLLFSELMIWGFLQRRRTQRRLASALELLGPMSDSQVAAGDGLSVGERVRLLEELVASMETRDPYLHGHSRRVARHAWMIARRMGLPREEVARIRTAAAIHDVGKTRTPKAILHKPAALTDEEYAVIKRHPGEGADMAQVLHDPELTAIVRHHHERLDGSGYPRGLLDEQIPLGARIIAVADTFDAITSARPYRAARPHRQAIDILRSEADTKLDGAVVRAFCSHYAGRRSLTVWSFLAGLPERVLSWLGGGVGSAISAAKVAAAAVLVGGVAASTATLGLPTPASTDRPTAARRSSLLAPALASRSASQTVVARMTPVVSTGQHHATHSPSASPTPALASVTPQGGGSSTGGGEGGGVVGAGGGEAPGKGERSPPPKNKEEAHGKEEAPGKEETHRSEEAQGKSEEGQVKGEEARGVGKSEEAPGAGEVHGTEEAHNAEEAHGKSEAGVAEAGHASGEEGRAKGKAQRLLEAAIAAPGRAR